jgi:hypothetical protein
MLVMVSRRDLRACEPATLNTLIAFGLKVPISEVGRQLLARILHLHTVVLTVLLSIARYPPSSYMDTSCCDCAIWSDLGNRYLKRAEDKERRFMPYAVERQVGRMDSVRHEISPL